MVSILIVAVLLGVVVLHNLGVLSYMEKQGKLQHLRHLDFKLENPDDFAETECMGNSDIVEALKGQNSILHTVDF